MKLNCCLVVIFLLFAFVAFSQDYSNKGKDFYITYPAHIDGNGTSGSVMGIYITSDVAATGTITVGTQTINFTVAANTVTRKFIGNVLSGMDASSSSVYLSQSDGITTNGAVHVVSDNPVAVYAHIIKSARSGATLVLPTSVLGNQYIVPSYASVATSGANGGQPAITVVATEANTTVQITPTATTLSGKSSAYTVTLANAGDVYQVLFTARSDISGTKVQAIAGSGGSCKKIAVFSSTTWSAFGCSTAGSGDNLYQQLFPVVAWGKNFLTAPTKTRISDIVRVYVADASTVVTKTENGITTTLTGLNATGNYYQYTTGNATFIQADKPISTVQFMTTQACQNGATIGDPEMIVLNPIEQTINNITVFSAYPTWVPPNQSQISNCYLNIIIRTNAVSSFKINGSSPSSSFIPIAGTQYSYLQEEITNSVKTNPISTLTADSSFIAIAYGLGNVESYGYNAGTSVKDFTKIATFQNQYTRLDSAVACINSPFKFAVPLSFQPTTIKWDFSAAPNISPANIIGPIANPVADSTPVSSGLHYFSTGNTYTFLNSNTATQRDTIKVYTTSATADGCGSTDQKYSIPVTVTGLPIANFSVPSVICISDSVQFKDASGNLGTSSVISGLWTWGDGTTDSLKNPKHKYLQPNTYNIRYRPITSYGCIGDTTIPFTMVATAVPKFVYSDSCIGKTITFTDSSTIASGSMAKWYWDYGDGTKDTLTTNANRTKTYTSTGTYNVSLVVENNTGCKSNPYTIPINVKPNPAVNFGVPSIVCLPVGAAQFKDSSTIADGTSSSFKYNWSFGDGGTDTAKNPLHYYTATGTYNVKLTTTSKYGCVKDTTIQFSNIYSQPHVTFTIGNQICLRDSTASLSTQFNETGPNASSLSPLKYFWNFGDGSSDTTASPKHRYAAKGIDTVKYWVISNVGCMSDTAKQTVTVNPLPTANFTTSAANNYCENKPITFIDKTTDSSITTGVTINKWYWDMGNGTILTPTGGFNTSFNQYYSVYGVYNVRMAVQNSIGCKSDTITIPINLKSNPAVNFGVPSVVCLPVGAAQFTDSTTIADGTASTFKYKWNFGDGGVDSVKNPLHNYTATGTYNVKLSVTSQYGCVKDTTIAMSNIYSQPHVAFTFSDKVCLRDTAKTLSTQFTETGPNSSSLAPAKYFWNFGDGGSDTTASPKHKYVLKGIDTVTYWVISNVGCMSDTAKQTITINPLPTANFVTAAANNYCENRPITFTDKAVDSSITTGVTISKWYWDMGNGTTLTPTGGFNTSFNQYFNAYGVYNVKMAVQNSIGCNSDTLTKAVTVNPQPHPGFILPEICLSDATADFIDTSTIANNNTIPSYLWNFNAAGNSHLPSPGTATTHNGITHYTFYGNYTVSLKLVSNNGCDTTLSKAFTVNGSTPKAGFTLIKPNNLCSNDSVRFIDASTVDFGTVTQSEIYWDVINKPTVYDADPNPSPQTNKQYAHLYTKSATTKTYKIKLVAHSGISPVCADSISKVITLNQSPYVQFTTIPGICNDTTTRLITQASEVGGVQGSYAFYGTGVSANGTYTPQSVAAGTYPVKYVYTTAIGCADSATQNITVWPSPVAKWGVNALLCEKNNISFTDSSVANYSNIVKRYWNFGDNNTAIYSNTNAFNYTYASAGSYTASLRVMTDSGCRSTYNTQILKVNYLPVVNFGLPGICLPDGRGTFTDSSTIGDGTKALFSYLWNFGDANDPTPSTLQNPTHKYVALGPYSVKLKITSSAGCIDSTTKQLTTVYPQPKAAFTATPDTACFGNIIAFTDSSNGMTSAAQKWYWDLSGGTTSNLQNPNKKFTDTGSFNISLYIYNAQGCISDTAVKQVVIYPYPKLNIGPSLFVLQGGTVALIPTYIYGHNLQYAWTPTTFLDSPAIRNPHATPPDDITYTLTVTGDGGCAVNDNVFIKVLKAPTVPNAFSPNGDGVNDTWVIKYLESYPGATVDVFDRNGQKVFHAAGTVQWDGTFNGKPLPVGTYYYIVDPKNGRAKISGSVTIIK